MNMRISKENWRICHAIYVRFNVCYKEDLKRELKVVAERVVVPYQPSGWRISKENWRSWLYTAIVTFCLIFRGSQKRIEGPSRGFQSRTVPHNAWEDLKRELKAHATATCTQYGMWMLEDLKRELKEVIVGYQVVSTWYRRGGSQKRIEGMLS